MNQSALVRTEPGSWTVGMVLLAASFASLIGQTDRRIPAVSRTELDGSMNRLARVEGSGTEGTSKGAAGVANGSCSRTRQEILPTFPASNSGRYCRRPQMDKMRVGNPESVLSGGMTDRTERQQVRQLVCHAVVGEEMKWSQVVNRESGCNKSALLAGITIATARGVRLLLPVWPTVLGVSALPCRIVRPSPDAGRTPDGKASAIAKVVRFNGRRLFVDGVATGMANDPDSADFGCVHVTIVPSGQLKMEVGYYG